MLDDLSGRMTPQQWAARALEAYRSFQADRIVAEVNNGGDMVEATLRVLDPAAPYKPVRASRGKAVRAEPVAALYEKGRVHHVGAFPALEDQMCGFTVDVDRAGRPHAAGVLARPARCAGVGADRADGGAPGRLGLLEYYRRAAAQHAADADKTRTDR